MIPAEKRFRKGREKRKILNGERVEEMCNRGETLARIPKKKKKRRKKIKLYSSTSRALALVDPLFTGAVSIKAAIFYEDEIGCRLEPGLAQG